MNSFGLSKLQGLCEKRQNHQSSSSSSSKVSEKPRTTTRTRTNHAAEFFTQVLKRVLQTRLRVRTTSFCLLVGLFAFAVFAGSEPSETTDAVECANLIYAGTKSSVCFSEEFLSSLARDSTIKTSRKFKPVKLGESEVFRFPFAVMTGEGAFSLTESERANLKLYLEKGGFLLASAGCSSKEWSDAFEQELKAIFPNREFSEVQMDHPIFHTVYDIDNLDTKQEEAKLLGLSIGGKVVLIYSPDGLNDTATQHGCCCCGGNEIKNAQKINANILAYALLQ